MFRSLKKIFGYMGIARMMARLKLYAIRYRNFYNESINL
jgi:hypothetical protein